MPRPSRTPSPTLSPPTKRLGGSTWMPAIMSSTPSPVTYIPPLLDGACGTTPRSQQPLWTTLRHEMAQILPMMPGVFWAMLLQQRRASWADTAGSLLRAMLACLEMGMLLTAIPLWLMLPGGVFASWICVCAALVMALCRMLNGKEQMVHCNAGLEGWMMGQEAEDEKWIFLGGMAMSSRHCHQQTLPALSRLFNRPMTCICMPTYGMPFDLVAMVLQRCLSFSTQARRTLYSQVRGALLDDSMNRCVILCHNDGAVMVSQAVAQLHADIPSAKLRKLEIYTFGAAACEFMMPLGELDMEPEPAPHLPETTVREQRAIHVEHFAMTDDPFAQIGVLQSVRQNMQGRFCGDIFVLNGISNYNNNSSSSGHQGAPKPGRGSMLAACSGLTMDEYLMALFPAQATAGGRTVRRGVLDGVVSIDRDCVEKREIAAMSNYHAASQAKKGGRRVSWTGLAAMAGQKNGMNAGLTALEMARRACRSCEGRKGREISWLARYAAMESKATPDGRRSP